MIDEKKLFELIKEYSYPITQFNNSVDIGMTLEGIKQAIDEQPKIGEWIPCSERLPEENQNVIACFAHGLVTELAFYDGKFHGIYSYNTEVITAWQPLPEAYHGQMD